MNVEAYSTLVNLIVHYVVITCEALLLITLAILLTIHSIRLVYDKLIRRDKNDPDHRGKASASG